MISKPSNGQIYRNTFIPHYQSIIMMKKLACHDVGLDCDFVIEGVTEEEVLSKARQHAYDIHAIRPEEMTSEMKAKIQENIRDT